MGTSPEGQKRPFREEQGKTNRSKRPGIDYGESFLPVVRLESLRTILALAAIRDLDVIQFDITSAYLHGAFKEEVFMELPEGYVAPGKGDWVWRLQKGWCRLGERGMRSLTPKDPTMYIKNS